MIDALNTEGWIFQITPMPGESIGHYLGRFRRANCLSQSAFAEILSIEVRLVRGLEMPSLGQPLNADQLRKLLVLLELPDAQLAEMLPQARSHLHLSTRLCPNCYADKPIHQTAWQQAMIEQCEIHQEPFLTVCPACFTGFRLPALWENGSCEQCWLPFSQMNLPVHTQSNRLS
jgi:TniQ